MTQRRRSKKTEVEPHRFGRRSFLLGAGAAACVGAGLWLRRKELSERDKTEKQQQNVNNPALPAGEWRAVWISYLEWALLDFSTADTFRAGCAQMLDDCAGLGLNTVLAQVRPFGDALYRSSLFPWSHLCTGVQGADPGFDPLDILLQEAHGRGLSVEAWLNPYRLRSSAAMPPSLAENNLANTHPEWVCAVGDGLYLNPAEPAAADYVVQGVAELLQNYAVDGIHFDDYFYPTTEESIDAVQFAASGAVDLAAWRRTGKGGARHGKSRRPDFAVRHQSAGESGQRSQQPVQRCDCVAGRRRRRAGGGLPLSAGLLGLWLHAAERQHPLCL